MSFTVFAHTTEKKKTKGKKREKKKNEKKYTHTHTHKIQKHKKLQKNPHSLPSHHGHVSHTPHTHCYNPLRPLSTIHSTPKLKIKKKSPFPRVLNPNPWSLLPSNLLSLPPLGIPFHHPLSPLSLPPSSVSSLSLTHTLSVSLLSLSLSICSLLVFVPSSILQNKL